MYFSTFGQYKYKCNTPLTLLLGAIIKTKPKEYEIEYENENNCNTGNHNFDEFNSNFWTRTYHRGRNI